MKTGSTGAALIGWQTLLADLALILFMVTAAESASSGSARSGLASPGRQTTAAPAKLPGSTVVGEPLAVWRAGGSLTLAQWLAMEQPDGRQQLTITAHYRPGAQAATLAAVQVLVGQAGAMGQTARVIIAPAAGDEALATLAYDRAPVGGTAQGLLNPSGTPSARIPP